MTKLPYSASSPSIYSAGVNLIGDFSSTNSQSEIARNMYKTLDYLNIPVAANQVAIDMSLPQDDSSFILSFQKCPEARINLIHLHPPEIPGIFQKYGSNILKGRYNIGYWFFELPDIPHEWLSGFEYIDELWVASSFVQQNFEKVSPVPVKLMPTVVDVSTRSFLSRQALGLPTNRYLFVFSFAITSSLARKNPLGLIEAFAQAFPDTEDSPMLILKANQGGQYPAERKLLNDAVEKHTNILLMMEDMSRREMHSLLNACDCYVSLHRAEGFGLGLAESMYLGKPAIATGYSGNADFTRSEWSYPVNFRTVDISKEHFPGQTPASSIYDMASKWAEPDFDHAVDLLRYVYTNQDEAREKGKLAAAYIRQTYSYATTGQQIRERLETLDRDIIPLYTEKPQPFLHRSTATVIADGNALRIKYDEISRRFWLFRFIPATALLFRSVARFGILGKMWAKTFEIFEVIASNLEDYRLRVRYQQHQIDTLKEQIHSLTTELEELRQKRPNLEPPEET